MALVKYYDISEELLQSKAIEKGALICCSDTGNLFFENTKKERIALGRDIRIVSALPSTPIANKLYCRTSDNTLHMYTDGEWIMFGGRSQFTIRNITIPAEETITVEDSRILKTDSVVFVPDDSISDIFSTTDITITLNTDQQVTLTSSSSYECFGVLIVN